jgi:signal transduction histidine kinase
VIDHDVRRLDRLVSDIPRSRLDSNLSRAKRKSHSTYTCCNLGQYLGEDAKNKGIDSYRSAPNADHGLANVWVQVFVNLITNAIVEKRQHTM